MALFRKKRRRKSENYGRDISWIRNWSHKQILSYRLTKIYWHLICSPIHPDFLGRGRFKTCLGPRYFLWQLSDWMMETCILLAGWGSMSIERELTARKTSQNVWFINIFSCQKDFTLWSEMKYLFHFLASPEFWKFLENRNKCKQLSGQSYKLTTIVNYNSSVFIPKVKLLVITTL